MSEPIQSIAQNNYLLATPIGSGYMETSALEYDGDKISGYAGSAFAQGGGVSYSAGDNISISNDIISVTGLAQADWSATSGAAQILNKPAEKNLIAGANVTITESNDEVTIETTEIASGLQLVAGPGVTLTVSGNNIIAGLDETVLFENQTNSTAAMVLSEPPSAFNYIKLYGYWTYNGNQCLTTYLEIPTNRDRFSMYGNGVGSLNAGVSNMFKCVSDYEISGNTITVRKCLRKTDDKGLISYDDGIIVSKIVGINRIAGGN